MINKSIYASLMFVVFAVNTHAATETITIEHGFKVRCSVDHENAIAETSFSLPLEGRPYKFENVQVEELERSPSRNTLNGPLKGVEDNQNYYGSHSIEYLPSRENVEVVKIRGYAKRERNYVKFLFVRSPDSVLKLKLKFQFAHEAPVDSIAYRLQELATSFETEATNRIEQVSLELARIIEQLDRISPVDLTVRLAQAKNEYSQFVCPILSDSEDLRLQAIAAGGSDSTLISTIERFIAAVNARNNAGVRQNILDTMNIIGVQNDSLTQPICTGYTTPVSTGYYRAENTCGVYRFCDSHYSGVKNPDVMNCLGGFAQVMNVTQTRFDKILRNRNDSGHFAFNGFIRQADRCEVYRLYDNDKYCGVASPAQMNAFGGFGQVKIISNYNNLIEGRTYTGACQG
ncbi:MAG: hypothetical protein ABIQ95_16670 [Bdellovibrionia bacterium]